jgi:hypothetical protein
MASYKVYIPFVWSSGGELVDEIFSTIVEADNEPDAQKLAIEELDSEWDVKNMDSREIEVELCPDFSSFEEWEEKYTALKNPKADEDDEGLSAVMFDYVDDEYQTVRGHDPKKIWTVRESPYGLILTAGFGWVDRFGYILSEEQFSEEDMGKTFRV